MTMNQQGNTLLVAGVGEITSANATTFRDAVRKAINPAPMARQLFELLRLDRVFNIVAR